MTDPYRKQESRLYRQPIASREHLLKVVQRLGRKATAKNIEKAVKITAKQQSQALQKRLKSMVRDQQLRIKASVYSCCPKAFYAEGYAHFSKFEPAKISTSAGNFTLKNHEQHDVLHGDYLAVRVSPQIELAYILEVKCRPWGTFSAVVSRVRGKWCAQALHAGITQLITVENAKAFSLKEGDIIVLECYHAVNQGRCIRLISADNTRSLVQDMLMSAYSLPSGFPQAVLDEKPSAQALMQSAEPDRLDLTTIPWVTIDGEQSFDFDDAVYCERVSSGYRLSVAIADVSHFVPMGSVIDDEAIQRATSMYLSHFVIPMLPEYLSNDLCSLKPEENRKAVVVRIDIDARGRIKGFTFDRALIRSHARLTYQQVEGMIKDPTQVPAWWQSSYEALVSLYRLVEKRHQASDAIQMVIPEYKACFDNGGEVSHFSQQSPLKAHKIIEYCMIYANRCAADFLDEHYSEAIYRTHGLPSLDRLSAVISGVDLTKCSANVLREHINHSIEEDKQAVKSISILKCMAAAKYEVSNAGHFGLALDSYTHFTSPIRRYPDLMVHRAIVAVITEHKESLKQLRALDWAEYAHHCSRLERNADELQRRELVWLQMMYLQQHRDQVFDAVIHQIYPSSFYLSIAEIGCSGMLYFNEVVHEVLQYNTQKGCVDAVGSKRDFYIEDTIQVKLKSTDLVKGFLNFTLA